MNFKFALFGAIFNLAVFFHSGSQLNLLCGLLCWLSMAIDYFTSKHDET